MKPTLNRPFILIALLLAVISFEVKAVPYASGVTNNGGTISFVLNQAATSINVVFEDSSTLDLTGTQAVGTNTFSLGAHTSYSIVVSNVASSAVAQISSDTASGNAFFGPRGVTVNRNPKSWNFGRVYVVNASPGNPSVGGNPRTTTTRGIYVMDAASGDFMNRGTTAANTGYVFGTSTTSSPNKLFVGPDDKVYVSDNDISTTAHSALWKADAECANFTNIFDLVNISTAGTSPGVTNWGRANGIPFVTGSTAGGDLTITVVMFDFVKGAGGTALNPASPNSFNHLFRYAINGSSFPFRSPPTLIQNKISIGSINAVANDSYIADDGKIFIWQPRSTPTDGNTNMCVLDSTGTTILWDSRTQSINLWGAAGGDHLATAGGGSGQICVSSDGKYVLLGTANSSSAGNFLIMGLTNGIPDISSLFTNTTVGVVGAGTDRGGWFDAANNIYITSGGSDTLRVFSLGGSSVAVTTNDVTANNGSFSLLGLRTATNPHRTLAPGGTATFIVTNYGSTPSYQWYRNGSALSDGGAIAGSTTAKLTVTSAQDANAGTYYAIATGGGLTVTTTNMQLVIVDQPTPASTSVALGTTHMFSAVTAGTVAPVYTWRKGTTALNSTGKYEGTNTATLTILNAAGTDTAANYNVVVSDQGASATSANASLTVDLVPAFTTQPVDTTVALGGTTSLLVVATGNDLHYKWQTNGVDLADGSDFSGTATATLTILNASKSVERTNTDFYAVVVTNLSGTTTSANVHLTVTEVPVISGQPQSATWVAGTTHTLAVAATGPNLTYAWFLGVNPLSNGTGHTIAGATAATLTLGPLSQADAGSYHVVVQNTDGSVTSSDAAVTIIDPIVITLQPTTVTINPGDNTGFSVAVTGTSPVYQWKKGGVNLSNAGHVSGATTPNLTVTGATSAADSGIYTCVISNFAGAVTSSAASLNIHEAPAIITQPQTQVVGSTGVSATFTVVATGFPITYQWRLNGSDISGATASAFTIASVQKSDIGYYSVFISNDLGTVTSDGTAELKIGSLFFSDTLDSDTSANWHTNTSSADNRATWAFDYSTAGIPQLPGAANSKALKLEANISATVIGAISLSPNSLNISGNYQLRFNSWQNWTGPAPAGGTGSTESIVAAIGTSGSKLESPLSGNTADGVFIAANGDGGVASGNGSTPDYGIYTNASAGATATLVKTNTGAYAAGTTVDATTHSNPYYTNKFQASIPASQTALNASQSGTPSAGAFGFAWHEVILRKAGNVVTWSIDGNTIASVTNGLIQASGTNIALGYFDAFSSVAATNFEFGLFSKLKVESFTDAGVAPAITGQPQDTTVAAGSTAQLTVTATSPTTLRYQWQKGSVNLANATNATLTIANVQPSDAGSYHVLLFNDSASATSANATLSIQDPGITAQPASLTVAYSASAIFNVSASGTGTLTYQWRKGGSPLSNGGNISGATSASLTVISTTGADVDSYTVVVSGVSSVTSSSATLSVQDPGFISQPASITRNAGQDATFSVVAGGTGTLTYQWLDGNSDPIGNFGSFSGANTASLTIHSVVDAYGGNYSVVVTGTGGSITSGVASLSVIDAPQITTQPTSATKNAKTTATFSVVAVGTTPFTYQWRKGGVNLNNGGNIIGATSATLSVTNVLGADAGSYSVVVSNPAGSPTSSDAVLTVIDPLITAQPSARTNNLGDTATFTVTAIGTTPLSYQWKLNGTDIANATTSSYARTNIVAGDAGTYTVVVSNAAGSATSSDADLVILYPVGFKVAQWNFNSLTPDADVTTGNLNPSIGSGTVAVLNGVVNRHTTGTSSDIANLGNDNSCLSTTNYPAQGLSNKTAGVQFTVSTAAYNNIAVTWEQLNNAGASKYARFQYTSNGVDWTDRKVITMTQSTGFAWQYADLSDLTELNNNPNFAFRIVSEFESTAIGSGNNVYTNTSGSGSYVATSTSGAMRFDMVTIIASQPVAITSQPADTTVECGTSGVLNVTATGTGSLTYQWYTPDANGTAVSGGNAASLTVNNVHGATPYVVVVTDSYGSVTSSSATVTAVDTTAPVITVTAGPSTTCVGSGYSDPGATANDACEGSVSVSTSGSVNTGVAGAYTLTYSASDTSLNNSTATRVVSVVPCGDPLITSQPANVVAATGSNVVFSITAVGTGPLKYQWFFIKNGTTTPKKMVHSAVIPAVTNDTLSINKVSGAASGGSYYCVVSNALHSITNSANATLTVHDAPVVKIIPPFKTLLAGYNFKMVAKVTKGAVGQTVSYQWKKAGSAISDATNSTYSLVNVQTNDGAIYTCVVNNDSPTVGSNSCPLTVTQDTDVPKVVLLLKPSDGSAKPAYKPGDAIVKDATGTNVAPTVDFIGEAVDKGLIVSALVSNAANQATFPVTFVQKPTSLLATNPSAGKPAFFLSQVTLVGGTNIFYGIATDSDGNTTVSAHATHLFYNSDPQTLTLTTAGTGHVLSVLDATSKNWGNPTNTAVLTYGHNYTIKATATGHLVTFGQWVLNDPSALVSTNATSATINSLTFQMKTNLSITAKFSNAP